MVRKIAFALSLLLVLIPFVACDSVPEGEIRVPASAEEFEGENYKDVVTRFQMAGFTNISTEPIEDLITGWLVKDGEVEEVSINGKTSFGSSASFEPNATIIIRYHTFPTTNEETSANEDVENEDDGTQESTNNQVTEEILTVDNCPELKEILLSSDYSQIEEFANKYAGRIIEFDGYVADVMPYKDYKTRYKFLIYVGDSDETYSGGPSFQFVDVNIYDLHLVGENIPDYIKYGTKLHIKARVMEFNYNTGLFRLDPVETSVR
jgi:hypothetical protein